MIKVKRNVRKICVLIFAIVITDTWWSQCIWYFWWHILVLFDWK